MTDIREYLAHKPLLFDGGMGTYYKAAPGADCEMANLTDPDPECDLDFVPGSVRRVKLEIALSNSFGFGGTNGSLVFRTLK